MFTSKPLSYGDELPAIADLASPTEGYIYLWESGIKGLSAEPEVVLRVNPDVPRSEEWQLPCWRGSVGHVDKDSHFLLNDEGLSLNYFSQGLRHMSYILLLISKTYFQRHFDTELEFSVGISHSNLLTVKLKNHTRDFEKREEKG